MHEDGFGCLHTEDFSGHKIEGLPFLRKNTRRCTYAPQDAAVSSKGSPFMGEEVEITTKSPPRILPASSRILSFHSSPFHSSVPSPFRSPPFHSSVPSPFRSPPFHSSVPSPFHSPPFRSLCAFLRISASVSIPPDVIRHLPHPCASHNTNNPAISDRAASFSSSVLFAGDGLFGTVIDISGRAAKPDTRADYRLRHHLYLFYYWLIICLFHNNYCLLC